MSKDDLLETRRHLKTLHGGPDADPTGGMIDKCIRCSKGLRCEAHPRRHVPFWEPHHLVIKKPVQALPVKRSPPRVVPPTRRPFIPSQRKTHQSNHKERKRRKKRDVKPKPKVSRLLYDTKPFVDFDQPPETEMTPAPGALFGYYHPPLPLAKESKSQESAEAKLEKKVDENGNEPATVSKTAKEKVDPLDHTDGPLFEILLIEVTQCCREVDHNSNLAIEGGTKGPNPTKSVVCDECERRFASRVYLSTHIRLYHLGKPVMKRWKRRYRCLKCGESFTNVMRMRLHEDKKHAERFCVKCQRIFGTNSKFKEHVELVHREETNFKCVDCGLVFPQRQLLGRHRMSAHNGPRLFACPFKGCQHPPYRCSKALTAHIYTKHAHCKPFKCGQCGKKFVRDCDLKAHLEVHKVPVGVIPTFCKFCGAIFRQPRTCQKHEEECREINALNMATDCMSTTSVVKMEQKTTEEAGPSTSS